MRGRTLVFLVLAGFLAVASGVIWRRAVGIEQARRLREDEQRRADLEARRAALDAEVRDAASRERLQRIAEQRLGMRVPSDSNVILLPRPTPRGAP
jgi:cell division protein FtsL